MTSTQDIEARVASTLDSLGIQFEKFEIDPDYADTAAFCEKYGYSMDESGNTILVASKRGAKKYCACIVKATDRLDVNHAVKGLMEVSRVSFASPDDTREVTGMMIGGVTPFALPDDMPIYVDQQILALDSVILGSGSRSSKLSMAPEELKKTPNLQFIEGLTMPPRE